MVKRQCPRVPLLLLLASGCRGAALPGLRRARPTIQRGASNDMSNKPRVLNRTGHRVPDGAVYIGRAVPRARITGSKWGNPFKPTRQGDAKAHAVACRAVSRLAVAISRI